MADDQRSFLSKLFKTALPTKPVYEIEPASSLGPNIKEVVVHDSSIGSSGTEMYAGYLSEEYLTDLRGHDAAILFDKMRRSDSTIRMNLLAVKNPIKAAKWTIQPSDDSTQSELIAEQIEFILFKGMSKPWSQSLNEILTMIDFGWSAFEVQHKIINDHPEFGTFVGLKQLGYRSQKTIDKWNSDSLTGELLSVQQIAHGDFGRFVEIPAEFLLLFTLDEEGENHEGISYLRAVYGAWKRKQAYLKLMAIGVEKYAVPTPVLGIPEDKFNLAQHTAAVEVLRKYISGQQQYITRPMGWEIEFTDSHFDPEKLKEAIEFENREITRGFLANFLELGNNSSSGSYSLSFDQSDFFLGQLDHIACQICEKINNHLIPNLVKLNHGEQDEYPKLVCSGITNKAGKELAETLQILTSSKVVIPDEALEVDIRNRYNLPEKSEIDQRMPVDPLNPLNPDGSPKAVPGDENVDAEAGKDQPQDQKAPEKEVAPKEDVKASEIIPVIFMADPETSAKRARKLIEDGRDAMVDLMKLHLEEILDTQIKKILQKSQRLSKSQRLQAIKDLTFTGKTEYKEALKNLMAKLSLDALNQARSDVPNKKNTKLTEELDSFKLNEFDKLPAKLKRQINFLSNTLIGTQLSDIEKTLAFRFENATELESLADRAAELNKNKDEYLSGVSINAASGSTSANIINSARNAFYFDEEVSAEIESFTFENPDPETQICQELTGQTFSIDDPNFRRFEPPLHWNCKSVYVPNLKGTKAALKPLVENGLGPKNKSALASIKFSEQGDMMIHQIIVSKKLARTRAEALDLIMQYKGGLINTLQEDEFGYRVTVNDLSSIIQGTLKTFEPMEGVQLVFGNQKYNS